MTKRWEFIYLGKGNEDLSSRGRESGPSAVGNALHKTPGEKKKVAYSLDYVRYFVSIHRFVMEETTQRNKQQSIM